MSNWQTKKLGDVCDISRGGSPRPIQDYIVSNSQEGYPWLRIGDVPAGGRYIFSTSAKIRPEGIKKTTLVRSGEFILSNSMSYGRPYILMIDACIHDGWLALRNIKSDQMDKQYLYYLLTSSYMQNMFKNYSAGSGVQNLKRETVKEITCKVPTPVEQKRIVLVLQTWDEYLELFDKKIALKEQLKNGLVQRLLTGKIRLSNFSDRWHKLSLGEICQISTGKKDVNEGNPKGQYPFFSCSRNSTFSDSFSFDTEAILVAGNGDVGHCKYFSGKFEAYQRTYVLSNFSKTTAKYIYPFMQHYFQNFINSQKQMGAMPYIKLDMLKDYQIMLPSSVDEQASIMVIINNTSEELVYLHKKKVLILNQRKFLLNNLLSGKILTPENLSMEGAN